MFKFNMWISFGEVSQPTFTSTKSRIVALEKDVKYVPNLIIKTPEQTQ